MDKIIFPIQDITKSDVESFSQKMICRVKEGEIDPLRLRVIVKAVSDAIEQIDKGTRQEQLREAQKYQSKGSFKVFGAEVSVTENGVNYDYSACNDTVWNDLSVQIEELSKKKKERESYLRTLTQKTILLNDGDEIVAELYPPIKTSETGLKVKL